MTRRLRARDHDHQATPACRGLQKIGKCEKSGRKEMREITVDYGIEASPQLKVIRIHVGGSRGSRNLGHRVIAMADTELRP
ncbi:hypothetical protein TNCV_2880151 [Trichonephila clavipes]|uniref:Uncharacterized protein n=1 Tax=Trichonephila clavipes TaxID=2585209 RepID=A0A8X7BDQ1_TRICX|nr:hypothetical protein TNCV_2880151 [Trichonephila clavipes]